MAKKIRFPLEMDNGLEVRSMEELGVYPEREISHMAKG